MRGWLAHGVAAARIAGDRPELWLPGALGHFVYLGWVPLYLAVVPTPNAGDLTYVVVQLISSPIFPWNLVALALAVTSVVLLAGGVAVFAELVLISAVRPGRRSPVVGRVGPSLLIIALAALPALLMGVVVALRVSTIAPDVFFSTAGLGEIVATLASAVWPLLLLLLAVLGVGQAFGAVAIRALRSGGSATLAEAIDVAGREVVRHPLRRLGSGIVGVAADLGVVLVTLALLRVLWAPIGFDLATGRFWSASTLFLLLGFVAIWLALLLVAGAVRAWLSAWWSLEVSSEA